MKKNLHSFKQELMIPLTEEAKKRLAKVEQGIKGKELFKNQKKAAKKA